MFNWSIVLTVVCILLIIANMKMNKKNEEKKNISDNSKSFDFSDNAPSPVPYAGDEDIKTEKQIDVEKIVISDSKKESLV